jgi:membrane protease YdiL (CAAX protease family)
LVFALVFPTVVTLVYFVLLRDQPAELQQTAYTIGKAIQFAFPAFWAFVVVRERFTLHGPSVRALVMGIGFGALVLVLMVGLYAGVFRPAGLLDQAVPAVRDKVLGLQLNTIGRFVALGVFYALCHSLLEEYYWRWFVHGRLRRSLGRVPATCISSLGFMAHHVILLATFFGWTSPLTYLFSIGVAVGGAFWAWLYDSSRSLYGPWLSHLLIDAAIFLIGFDIVRDAFAY